MIQELSWSKYPSVIYNVHPVHFVGQQQTMTKAAAQTTPESSLKSSLSPVFLHSYICITEQSSLGMKMY